MTHSPPDDETNPDESDPGSEPGALTKRMLPPWQADFYQCSIEYVSFGDPNVNQDHVTQIPPPGCRARRTGAGWSWRCSSGAGWPPGHGRGERPHQHHRDHPDRLELAGVEVDVAPRSGGESPSSGQAAAVAGLRSGGAVAAVSACPFRPRHDSALGPGVLVEHRQVLE
ncbi:MAG: LodA/GoxA family CTQ-dependent oxidase [Solirubrobacterales bacterium]|nr:LodA/GoxA family CTQ-dependent oxidase [Solirubrobacterales bacterium]